jgi:integrase
MMKKPLYIPKGKSWKGLSITCLKCRTTVKDVCKVTGKPIQRCPFGDKHKFKLIGWVAGVDNVRKTKIIETRDIDEAIKMAIDFQKEVKEINHQNNRETKGKIELQNKREVPTLLVHCFANYLEWMNNEGVPSHLHRPRSFPHVKDGERAFKVWVKCLKKNRINEMEIKITDINDAIVGNVYDYLLKDLKLSNRSFNKYMGFYSRFLSWFTDQYDFPIKNYFAKVQRKKTFPDPQAISALEVERLLAQITPANGIKEYSTGKKKFRNFYREFLVPAIKLGLFSGRRREEITSIRWNDIKEDENGFKFIKVQDYKVNRIWNKSGKGELKFIYIPVTKELMDLLMELGYEENKNTDKFLIAPERLTNRNRYLLDDLTRGFSHFYEQLDTGRHLTFKSLRKAYITSISVFLGGNAKAITKHGDDAVIEKFYMDKKMMLKAVNGFQVFNGIADRKMELDAVRDEKRKHDISIQK